MEMLGLDTVFRKITVLEMKKDVELGGHFENHDGGHFQLKQIETSSF